MAPKPQPIRLKTLEERQVEALEGIAAALKELVSHDSPMVLTLDRIDTRLYEIDEKLGSLVFFAREMAGKG